MEIILEYLIAAYIIFAIICSILSYGLSMAFWEGEFPSSAEILYKSNVNVSLFCAFITLICPLAVIMYWFLSKKGKYGLKFRK